MSGLTLNEIYIATEQVARQRGARTPGVDGRAAQELQDPKAREQLSASLHGEIECGAYTPQPAREVLLDKPDGSKRSLRLPSLRDRIIQQMLRNKIEPLSERFFARCSYGFRPGRGPLRAIDDAATVVASSPGAIFVIKVDVAACFGSIPQAPLLDLVRRLGVPQQFVAQLQGQLQAGVCRADGSFVRSDTGVQQGSLIGPVLCNLYLNQLDVRLVTGSQSAPLQASASSRYFRYADDLVLIAGDEHHACEKALALVDHLNKLGLFEAPGKTQVRAANDGFDFLGFHLRQLQPGCDITVSQRSQQRLAAKVDDLMRCTRLTRKTFRAELACLLDGWLGYYFRARDAHLVADAQWQRATATSRGRRR